MQVDNTLILVIIIFILILVILGVIIAYRRRIKMKVLGTEFSIEAEGRPESASPVAPAGASTGRTIAATGERSVAGDSPKATIVTGDRDNVLAPGRKR